MRRTFIMTGMILAVVALLDLTVAITLRQIEPGSPLTRLVTYFEYGRSVPGKIARWREDPEVRGNLLEVAWIEDEIARSTETFASRAPVSSPVIRSYGMSFANQIMDEAEALRPDLDFERRSGPAAPPNFALDFFEADRPNRNPGDIVVLGILASSVPAIGALTNATWLFEQPAPFTYRIYRPDGTVVTPVFRSLNEYRDQTPEAAALWEAQLAREDAFHGWQTYGLSLLDASPFARLVRRTLATRHIAAVERDILAGDVFPIAPTLLTIVERFTTMASEDGQHPIVLLIQTRGPRDYDLKSDLAPLLDARDIPYLATADIVDVTDLRAFVPDGHYSKSRNRDLGAAFLSYLPP